MSDIQEIELSRDVAKETIAIAKSLTKLQKNRDFSLAIMKGYFEDEATRLINLLSDPSINEAAKADVMESLKAISHFKRYIRDRYTFANMAEKALIDYEEALVEARNADESEADDADY